MAALKERNRASHGAVRVFGRRLPLIPASYFGIVLGLGGLANGWRVAHAAYGVPAAIGEGLFVIAALAWGLVTVLYAWKWLSAIDAAREEAGHPVQCCFIGLAGVATLVMAQGALPHSRPAAMLLFGFGAAFTLGFGLWRTGPLWRGERETEATTSVLFLPVVAGGFVTATALGAFGWKDWAALAFGGAFFSWLAIESVVLHRLYMGVTLPPRLRPTLGIQLAPPAVGALAYLATGADPAVLFPKALVGFALLQGLLLLRMSRWIAEEPFAPSYWAVTFGVTALPTAVIRISMSSPTPAFPGLGLALFVVSNLVVLAIALRTAAWFLLPRPA